MLQRRTTSIVMLAAAAVGLGAATADAPVCDLGDTNQDGVVDLLDVAPFTSIVSNGGFQCEADVNQDGQVDLLDVDPFISILTGG